VLATVERYREKEREGLQWEIIRHLSSIKWHTVWIPLAKVMEFFFSSILG